MKGLWATLTAEQRREALAYDGPESFGHAPAASCRSLKFRTEEGGLMMQENSGAKLSCAIGDGKPTGGAVRVLADPPRLLPRPPKPVRATMMPMCSAARAIVERGVDPSRSTARKSRWATHGLRTRARSLPTLVRLLVGDTSRKAAKKL
jgi:hypothetical protein